MSELDELAAAARSVTRKQVRRSRAWRVRGFMVCLLAAAGICAAIVMVISVGQDHGARSDQQPALDAAVKANVAEKTPAAATPSAPSITAKDLLAAYDTDPEAADHRFAGRELRITGRVAELKSVVNRRGGGSFETWGTSTDWPKRDYQSVNPFLTFYEGRRRIKCFFGYLDMDALNRVHAGQEITLIGRADRLSAQGDVLILDCEFVRRN